MMNQSQHTAQMESDLKKIESRHQALKREGLGYYRIPDLEKYKSHSWEVLGTGKAGNCFQTNWDKYQELKKQGASAKLVVGEMRNGIVHAFIIDGDVRYDYSQFREIKEPLDHYTQVNQFTSYSFYDGDDRKMWDSLCALSAEGIHTRQGQLKIDRTEGTMYKAMKSIIDC